MESSFTIRYTRANAYPSKQDSVITIASEDDICTRGHSRYITSVAAGAWIPTII